MTKIKRPVIALSPDFVREVELVKKEMTDLEKYKRVNKCETLEELAGIIIMFAEDDGMIQGRTRRFSAHQMAKDCLDFCSAYPNTLTREFGIRQQAMYISYYSR